MNKIFMITLILLIPIKFPIAQSSDQIKSDSLGILWIAPVCTSNAQEVSLGNPCGGNRDFNFSIKIDSLPTISVSNDSCQAIKNLSTVAKHRVIIYQSGKPKESFTFNFKEQNSNQVLIYFKALYETWTLIPHEKHKFWCKPE